MTIVEFLEARIAEDEVVARVCADADHEGPELRVRIVSGEGMYVFGPHEVAPSGRFGYEEDERTRHFERHDPARVLREVAAKRAIIAAEIRNLVAIDGEWGCGHNGSEIRDGKCDEDGSISKSDVLRALSSVYADHPDFNPDWAE